MFFQKFVFLFLSITLLVVSITDARGKHQKKFSGFMFSIIKPSQRSGYVIGPDSICLDNCRNFLNYNEEFFELDSKPWFTDETFNETRLKKYCDLSNSMINCALDCPEGPSKTDVLVMNKIDILMCNKSEYVKHAPCYKTVLTQVESVCSASDKCGPVLANVRDSYSKWSENETSTSQNFVPGVDCQYYSCYLACMRERVVQSCTESAFNGLKSFIQKSLEYFKEIKGHINEEYLEPIQCTRLRNEDDD